MFLYVVRKLLFLKLYFIHIGKTNFKANLISLNLWSRYMTSPNILVKMLHSKGTSKSSHITPLLGNLPRAGRKGSPASFCWVGGWV